MTDINNDENDKLNRREFINKVAIGSVAGAGGLFCIASIKSCLPKVLNEPPSIFKVGFPNDFSGDSVNFLANNNIFILRDSTGFKALSAICTHLGCIVEYTGAGYSCPCHGSKFNKMGDIIAGPAPRGLDWFEISMAPDGQLVINSKVRVNQKTMFTV